MARRAGEREASTRVEWGRQQSRTESLCDGRAGRVCACVRASVRRASAEPEGSRYGTGAQRTESKRQEGDMHTQKDTHRGGRDRRQGFGTQRAGDAAGMRCGGVVRGGSTRTRESARGGTPKKRGAKEKKKRQKRKKGKERKEKKGLGVTLWKNKVRDAIKTRKTSSKKEGMENGKWEKREI